MEVVINNCYGGFNLSLEAIKRLYKVKLTTNDPNLVEVIKAKDYFSSRKLSNEKILEEIDSHCKIVGCWTIINSNPQNSLIINYDRDTPRHNPNLISVVKKLKSKANGMFAELKIVEIPDDTEYEIKEYDGNEWVAETHRTWQ